MRKNASKVLSLFISIFFIFSLINVNTSTIAKASSQEPNINNYAVVVGNFFGNDKLDWKPDNLKGLMKTYSKGIYETSLELEPKNYEYKIAINGNWAESYGNSGSNISLKLTNKSRVYFRLDYLNKKVYDSVNNPEQFKSKATLVGTIGNLIENASDWNPKDDKQALNYIGGGFYSRTFDIKETASKKQYYLNYKIAYNGEWNNGEVGNDIACKIPANTKKISFLSNYLQNSATDSINSPNTNKIPSLIGTLRGEKHWEQNEKGWEFYPLNNNGVFAYSGLFKKGNYSYKACINYDWSESYPSDNKNLTIEEDNKYVVFILDLSNKKLYDSANDYNKVCEILGFIKKPIEVKGATVLDNGTIKFMYKNKEAKDVFLVGNITDSQTSKRQMFLEDKDEGIWSLITRIGDKPQNIEYKFLVDGKMYQDPNNENPNGENSIIKFNGFNGRPITLPGSIQTAIGKTAWEPADKDFQFSYLGNGLYKYVLKGASPGSYEYKIAINFKWEPENYGLNGVEHGSNIPINIPKKQDITFLYNDDSHRVVDNINYKALDINLHGKSITSTKLTDTNLTGIYSATLDMKKGAYDDLSLTVKEGDSSKEVPVGKIELSQDKSVKISYDPATEFVFNDASDNKLDINGISYDSKKKEYKSVFGAIKTDASVDFNLKIKKDMAFQVKMILTGPNGAQKLEMSKNGSFEDGNDRWTLNLKPSTIGTYSYYFVISNGSDVKAYGDDDGFFGPGICNDLGKVKNYEFNVFDKNFKTPDWLKQGIIYQIFPDRFFNGDSLNDYSQKYARGNVPYEFYKSWYNTTENPDLELSDEGKYAGTKGDGIWANEMYGGDLIGVQKKLDYLQGLGVTILYFNPIGQSISNHRYDTSDYNNVDPLLGHMDDFVNLVNEAKKRNMHIILDGVFNHVSDDSIYFDRYGKFMTPEKPLGAYKYWEYVYDTMKKENINQSDAEAKAVEHFKALKITDLHYKDWFNVENVWATKDKDNKPLPKDKEHYYYEGWWGYDSMPVIKSLNGSEYQVKSWANEIIDGKDSVTRKWLRNGSNGWRLDVANEVSDETWQHFRTAVKEESKDNAIVGEIWTDASKYILGDMYDSVMNYRFRGAIGNFVNGKTLDGQEGSYTALDATKELEKMREQYPQEALDAMMNLVGSHDTQRIISALDGVKKNQRGFANDPSKEALSKMRLIPFLQMTLEGAPTIYYGDEAGTPGCDDPDNRRGMLWGKGNKELALWYSLLGTTRNKYEVLKTGSTNFINLDKDMQNDVLAFERSNKDDYALIIANRKAEKLTNISINVSNIKDGTILTNALNSSNKYTVKDGKVSVDVDALNGLILVKNYIEVIPNYSPLKDVYDKEAIVKDRNIPKPEADLIK